MHAAHTIAIGCHGHYLFGRAVYSARGRLGPRRQKAFQLVVLAKGSLRLEVDDRTYRLNPGQAALLQPGGTERFYFDDKVPSVHTWCEVFPRHFSPLEKRLLQPACGVHRAPLFINLLIQEGLLHRNVGESLLHLGLSKLAQTCLLQFALSIHASAMPSTEVGPPALERAIEKISAQFRTLSSAADLAVQSGISVSHLRLLFQKYLRESPTAFIWRLKVQNAIQLLRSTGLSLAEVADQCGIANPYHLSRLIKRATGETPRQLRQREWRTAGRCLPPNEIKRR